MQTTPSMFQSLVHQLEQVLLGYGSLWTAIATMVLSIAVPLLIIIGKQAVRRIRAETFLRLESSFLKPNNDDTLDPQEALMDPTFDSVRCKYLDTPLPDDDAQGKPLWSGYDRLFGWLMPTLLYGFSVVVFGVIVAFFVDRLFISGWFMAGPGCGGSINACLPLSAQMLLLGLRVPSPSVTADLVYAHNTAVMLGFAFAGAYLWCVLYLIRRVNNYDLTPYSFLLCGMRILLALAIALTIRHTVFTNASLVGEHGSKLVVEAMENVAPNTIPATTTTTATSGVTNADAAAAETPVPGGETTFATYLAILTAFLLGFYPAAGMDYLIRRGQEFAIKKPHPDAAGLRNTLPLDMIDGLTDYVRFRLEELEYEDVQNLATANPVLLYVETPYNILEIIDWIAQAQLITAIGPRKVQELRKLNVRTIFDLARLGDSNHFRRCTLQILIEPESFRDRLAAMPDDEIQAVFVSMFTSIADDLHVIRLARVWNAFYAVYQRDKQLDVATRGLLNKPEWPATWMEAPATLPAAVTAPPRAAE